jgi:hypothetical protein
VVGVNPTEFTAPAIVRAEGAAQSTRQGFRSDVTKGLRLSLADSLKDYPAIRRA